MPVLKNGIPFLSFYFEHTLLYYLAVIIFIAAVAGIFGMFVLACSYFILKARILLFLPLFLLVRIFSVLDQDFQNRVLESGGVYINLDLKNTPVIELSENNATLDMTRGCDYLSCTQSASEQLDQIRMELVHTWCPDRKF